MIPMQILETGDITLEGQFLWGSNYTLLVEVSCGAEVLKAVYKPTEGVRPLWDFEPHSLAYREVMAYLVSEQLGWRLVPPTVFRIDGPHGPGSLQLFIEHDPEQHFFTFSAENRLRLRPAVLFDVVINNADRKGGHFIMDACGHIWLIDHGVCFHEDNKLRTVDWEFAGDPLPVDLSNDMARLAADLRPDSAFGRAARQYLSEYEVQAMERRISRLLTRQVFPAPPSNTRPYPWPLV